MPPVAQVNRTRQRTGLTDIVTVLLRERELSMREFAKRVSAEKGTTRESEKTTIANQMERYGAEDDSFQAWAKVLGVPRETFPPAPKPLTTAHLDRRLRQLEEIVGTIEEGRTVADLLEELAATAAGTLERLRLLESRGEPGGAVTTVTP